MSSMLWLIGFTALAFVVWTANEVWLFNHYPINILGFTVNYDYAVFAYIFFGYRIIRKAYAGWHHPPTGWTKIWWRIYRKLPR